MSRSRLAFVVLIALLAAGVMWLTFRRANVAPTIAPGSATSASDDRARGVALDSPVPQLPARDVAPPNLAQSAAPPVSSASPAQDATSSLLLYGFVRPPEGRATLEQNTSVSLTDRAGHATHTDVGSDCTYSFSGLQPGHYWLRAGSHNGGTVRLETDLDGSVTEKRLDVQLTVPRQVLVKVLDGDGKPIRDLGLIAIATVEPPGNWCEEIVGSINNPFGVGHFWSNDSRSEPLDDAYCGRVLLDVAPPVFVSLVQYQRVVATQRVEPGVREVTFTIDRASPLLALGSLRFRFVDAETRAVLPTNSAMLVGLGMSFIKSDGDVFRSAKLPPGYHEIRARVPEYEQLRKRVLVEPGVEQDLGDIELNRERWIAGTIVDDEGRPSSLDLLYEIYDRALGAARNTDVVTSVGANTDGSFRIGGLSRDTYFIRPSGQDTAWAIWSKVIDTTSGPVENVRIQLVRGVPLVVRASDPDTWSTVRFTIIDSTGARVRSTRLWAPEPQPILLAPGSYVVEVRANASSAPKRIPVTIASQPVELALP